MDSSFGKTLFGEISNDHLTLFIPRYQRAYKWGAERVVTLSKMMWAAKEEPRDLFLGAIITAKHDAPAGAALRNIIDVVDGQQRMTSFVLIAASARHLLRGLQPPPTGIAEADQKQQRLFEHTVTAAFPTKIWGDNFGGPAPTFRMRNACDDRQAQWTAIFDTTDLGEPVAPIRRPQPLRADVDGQYAVNYAAIYDELATALAALADDGQRRTALTELGDFMRNRVKVLRVHAPDLASARAAFRIANLPGEPLDFVAAVKASLFVDLDRDISSELLAAFARAAPGDNDIYDETAVRAVMRAYTGTVDIGAAENALLGGVAAADALVRRRRGGGGGGGGGAAAAVDAAHVSKLLGLHADLVGLKEHPVTLVRAAARAPYLPRTATDRLALGAKRLFQLEQAAWKRGDEKDFDEESVFWRSTTVALFDYLHIGKAGDNWEPEPAVERAADALKQLERLMLSLALGGGSKKDAIERILAAPVGNMIGCMEPGPDQVDAAIAALDGPLYGAGASKTYALRHLLVRLNTLWSNEVLHVDVLQPPPVVEADLRFFKDWTVEHIYPQSPSDADIARNQEAYNFFHEAATKRLHWLGNLVPLHRTLNGQASNDIFEIKRGVYITGHNVLVQAACRLDGYERGAARDSVAEPIFMPTRFEQRHKRLKELVMEHVFGRAPAPAPPAAPPAALPPAPPPAPEDGAVVGGGGGGAAALPRARLALAPLPGLHSGRDRLTVYEWALANWVRPEEAGPLRAAIDALVDQARGPGFAAAGDGLRLARFHQLAGDPSRNGFTKYILFTRRVDIVARFANGEISLADFA